MNSANMNQRIMNSRGKTNPWQYNRNERDWGLRTWVWVTFCHYLALWSRWLISQCLQLSHLQNKKNSIFLGFSCGSAGKESTCIAGDLGSIPGLGRSIGEGKGYPLQYSGLEKSMDFIVHGVTESLTRLSDFHFSFSELWELNIIAKLKFFINSKSTILTYL